MSNEPPILDYGAKPPSSRTWGLSRPVWLLVTVFFAVWGFADWFATNGRIDGWDDIAFIGVFAALTLMALINAIRSVPRAK